VPPGTWPVAANTTITANILLKPESGAVLTVATGVTLTINGPFEAGLYQVFSCTGTGAVHFAPSSVTTISPLWWFNGTPGVYSESGQVLTTPGTGDFSPAIRAAVTCKASGLIAEGSTNCQGADVLMPAGAWPGVTSLNLTNLGNFTLRGINKYSTYFYSTAAGYAAIDTVGANNYILADYTTVGDPTSTPTVGLLGGRTASAPAGGTYTYNRIRYAGSFTYGCEYTVAVEDINENDCRCFMTSSGFYHRRSPQNTLGLSSKYVTISNAYGGDSTAAWFNDVVLTVIPPATLQPFILDGPSGGGINGATHIHNGYIQCGGAGVANQVVQLNNGAEDVHLSDLDIEGDPQTLFRVTQTDSTQRYIFNLTARDIYCPGIPYPMMADIYSYLDGCDFGTLLIGDGTNTNFSALGGMLNSRLGHGWWGTEVAGTVTIGNVTNGASFNGCELVMPSAMTLTLLGTPAQGTNFIQRVGGATPSYQLGYLGAAVTTPAGPYSGTPTQNPNNVPCRVTISTVGGTVSVIAKGTVSGSLVTTNVTLGTYSSATVLLQAGEYIALTYSGTAPTWAWAGM
jgi:hypothetical protein